MKFLWISLLSLILSCDGCFIKSPSTKTSIRLGVIDGPEALLWEQVKIIARDTHDLSIELVLFNDYATPNIALFDKSIDANAFQHEPYLTEMVNARGYDLSAVAKTFVFPLAAYSKKISSKNSIPHGARVAIPNDPTNGGRALLLLHKHGFIELNDATKILPTTRDIVSNPKKLVILEIEAAQLPRVLDDVDLAIINTTFASSAGLSPTKDGLFLEGNDSRYVNIIAVRTNDKDAPWVKLLVHSVQCARIVEEAKKVFAGNAIPAWDEAHHD